MTIDFSLRFCCTEQEGEGEAESGTYVSCQNVPKPKQGSTSINKVIFVSYTRASRWCANNLNVDMQNLRPLDRVN